MLGQDLVLFRDAQGSFGLLDRDCPHRGADLAFGRNEGDGLRCPFHGWKFDATGQCIETPAEPAGSQLCTRIRQRSYPVQAKAGVLFGWFGAEGSLPPPLPALDCFEAPPSHSFAFKGLWHCNWLQAFEVGIDPAHASFLHRFFQDAALEDSYGKQFRGASAGDVGGERWPMTRVMREFGQPEISFTAQPYGFQLTALRKMTDELTHVRVTNAVFPQTFVIPLSETMTITQMHVPVDDTHNLLVRLFHQLRWAGGQAHHAPAAADRRHPARLHPEDRAATTTGASTPKSSSTRTYLGMGEDDINVHDQWACESMGAIQDRTREHLGTTDKVIMANRRLLLQAIETVANGGTPPGIADPALHGAIAGPDTVDGIAPAEGWQAWWQAAVRARREAAPWRNAVFEQMATAPQARSDQREMKLATFASRCGVHDAAREAACQQAARVIEASGLHSVRLGWCDVHGQLRGKTLMAAAAVRALRDGVGMVGTLLLKDTADRTAWPVFEAGATSELPGFAGAANLILLPDPASLVQLPWDPGTGWLRCQPWFPDGRPVALDTRRVLQAALARLAETGHGLKTGLEVEFHIYRITDTAPQLDPQRAAWPGEPPDVAMVHPGYQLQSEALMDMASEPLAIVRRTAQALGLPLQSLEIELGPSQVEAVFDATDALTAADQMVLFRNGVRQALRRAGYHASFMCRPPFPHIMSSGWHLHQSLVDLRDGRNAFARETPAEGSAPGDARSHFVGHRRALAGRSAGARAGA